MPSRCSTPSRPVVGAPCGWIAKRPVGFVDGLKAGLCLRARVVVGMVEPRAAVKRRPDLVGRCPGLDTQAGVISFRVHFGHHSCPVHKLPLS